MKKVVLMLSILLGIATVAPTVHAQDSTIGQKVDDATITTKVKTKLVAERAGNMVKVNVDTTDGVVRLRGTVPTTEDKRKAEELTRLTAGVRRVVNELTVDGVAADRTTTPSASPATTVVDRHSMTGEVTDIDATHGMVKVKTSEGEMQLHFPPGTLRTLKKGDRITVDLGLRK